MTQGINITIKTIIVSNVQHLFCVHTAFSMIQLLIAMLQIQTKVQTVQRTTLRSMQMLLCVSVPFPFPCCLLPWVRRSTPLEEACSALR